MRRQQWVLSVAFKAIFLLFVFVLLFVIVAVIAIEVGGFDFLKWMGQHPAFSAKYNPHQWLSRGLALLILLLLVHKIWLILSFYVKRLLVWWSLWRRPAVTEPEQPYDSE